MSLMSVALSFSLVLSGMSTGSSWTLCVLVGLLLIVSLLLLVWSWAASFSSVFGFGGFSVLLGVLLNGVAAVGLTVGVSLV